MNWKIQTEIVEMSVLSCITKFIPELYQACYIAYRFFNKFIYPNRASVVSKK